MSYTVYTIEERKDLHENIVYKKRVVGLTVIDFDRINRDKKQFEKNYNKLRIETEHRKQLREEAKKARAKKYRESHKSKND
jgi:hypothetical protein